jgi:hypothetical protein
MSLAFLFPYLMLNMFWMLIHPSSGMILQQNYFIFQEQVYQPDKWIAMGSPISGTIAEIFLQHLEHIYIRPLIETKRILFYTRYTDDIIIYDNETNHDYLTQ